MCLDCGCQVAEEHEVRAQENSEAASANVPHGVARGHAFQAVADASQVGEGGLLGVEVAGQAVVLGRVGGQLYAIGGLCTHRQVRLADGALNGEMVVCPAHKSGFSLRTGAAVRRPALEPVPCYEVKVEDGQVLVSCEPAVPAAK